MEATLATKAAYESFAASNGVKIQRYHEDNGHFAEQECNAEVESSNQMLNFFGVGANLQNGIPERHIK